MILALALFAACAPDDVTDDTTDTADTVDSGTDTDTGTDGDPGVITGEWVSQGDDISDLFAAAPFNYTRIDASFAADGSYLVTSVNADGASTDLTGTYVVDTSTNPGTIVLTQATPYAATAEGIWQVVDGVLTYEVVQTVPDYGYTPPTPSSGFGTTGGPNIEPGVNVQIYRAP